MDITDVDAATVWLHGISRQLIDTGEFTTDMPPGVTRLRVKVTRGRWVRFAKFRKVELLATWNGTDIGASHWSH